MFSSSRKMEFLNYAESINKENIDKYFLCLIAYKKKCYREHIPVTETPEFRFSKPALLALFNIVYFLLGHVHYLLL